MSEFYRKLSIRHKSAFVFGQIFWAPSPQVASGTVALRLPTLRVGQNVEDCFLEPVRLSNSAFGNLTESDRVDLRKKMPMPELGLELSEEITLVKAKMRPAVLMHRDCLNHRREADYLAKVTGKPVAANRRLFAPIFSLKKETGERDFPQPFIDLVSAGKLPHIIYLPAYVPPIINESMLVLTDQFQAGINAVQPTDLCIDPETLAIKIQSFEEFRAAEACRITDEINEEIASKR